MRGDEAGNNRDALPVGKKERYDKRSSFQPKINSINPQVQMSFDPGLASESDPDSDSDSSVESMDSERAERTDLLKGGSQKGLSPDKKHTDTLDLGVHNDPRLELEPDVSLGAILKGTAATPLTIFERKAALINAELDKFGLGRYQICIWFLCGFGYFLDLAWAQGIGLVASAIYQEMGVPASAYGNIWSLSNAGLAVGAFTFGILVDIIGRKWAFNLTCLICSVFGLLVVRSRHCPL